MSLAAMKLVRSHSKARGNAYNVLMDLADWANDEMECWPSVSTIAERCRLKERGTQAILSKLEQSGEITRRRRYGTGATATTVYRITIGQVHGHAPVGIDGQVHGHASTGAPGCTGQVHGDASTGAPPCADRCTGVHPNPHRSPTGSPIGSPTNPPLAPGGAGRGADKFDRVCELADAIEEGDESELLHSAAVFAAAEHTIDAIDNGQRIACLRTHGLERARAMTDELVQLFQETAHLSFSDGAKVMAERIKSWRLRQTEAGTT